MVTIIIYHYIISIWYIFRIQNIKKDIYNNSLQHSSLNWCKDIIHVLLAKWVIEVINRQTFASISINWYSNFTNRNYITLFLRFYLIKCRSIFICLVRSCWTGLWEMSMAVLLSQNKTISKIGAWLISISSF